MDKFKSLRTFCSVVELGSFTKTAEQSLMSKAAISNHIKALEDELNVTLIKRHSRGVSITKAGHAYYERVNELLQQFNSADEDIKQYDRSACGHIRISLPVSMGLLFASQIICDFMEQHPDIIIEATYSDQYVDILKEKYDLALRGSAKLPDTNIKARKIGRFQHVVCASPKYFELHGKPHSITDLKRHPALIYTGITAPFSWFFNDPGTNTLITTQVTGRYQSNNSLALKQAAISGRGLLRIPNIYVRDEILSGQLVEVLSDYRPTESSVWILYNSSQTVPHRVRLLIDFLAEHFQS